MQLHSIAHVARQARRRRCEVFDRSAENLELPSRDLASSSINDVDLLVREYRRARDMPPGKAHP